MHRLHALGPGCALASLTLAVWPLSAAPAAELGAAAGDPTHAQLPVAPVTSVFHIEKSENKNQVHYAVQVDRDCRPLGEQPVYGYWRDLERGPTAVSQLLEHEQPAYGLRSPRQVERAASGGAVQVSLRAFPDRPLRIELLRTAQGCGARALTTIAGQPAVLSSIYVEIGFLFSVKYALLRGTRVSDGRAVQEKIHD